MSFISNMIEAVIDKCIYYLNPSVSCCFVFVNNDNLYCNG